MLCFGLRFALAGQWQSLCHWPASAKRKPKAIEMDWSTVVKDPTMILRQIFAHQVLASGDSGMYVIIEDGSRQYRVQEGDVVKLDYREAQVGSSLEFDRVLLYQNEGDTRIGQPLVAGAKVVGEVVDHPSTKLYIQHFRRRKNYRRLKGHRQPYTSVKINKIVLPGAV